MRDTKNVRERIEEIFSAYKFPILLSFVGLTLILFGVFSTNLYKSPVKKVTSDFPKESILGANQINSVTFDISGAVNRPGVYAIEKNSRLEDGVKMAGGFSASASAEYIAKSLNLSQKITDGQKIYIPYEGEEGSTKSSISNTSDIVNINTAGESELDKLPGVGPTTAGKIIQNRPFSNVEELLDKKVVNKATFEKIRDLVSI